MSASWYPDPAKPGQLRWWDGQQWTGHVQPAASPAAFGADPGTDLAAEARSGRAAAASLIPGAVGYAAQYVLGALAIGRLGQALRQWLNAPRRADGTLQPFVLPPGYLAWNLLLQVCGLGLLAVGVLFLIWFHRAATFSQRAGLPARHSTGWAVAGFLVPVVNVWFPYQAAMDMIPAGHPGRRMVRRWWALWLATSFGGIAVMIAGFFSTGLGVVLALVLAAVAFAAAIAARAVIAEVERAHVAMIRR